MKKSQAAANAGKDPHPTIDDRAVDPNRPIQMPKLPNFPSETDPAVYPASPPVKPNPLEPPKGPPSR
jgi:hypothetical protein